MEKEKEYDLFNNPMVESAKKNLTKEQMDDYKKMGDYMYNSFNYKINEVGSQVQESKSVDLVLYATTALNSGLNPFDLTYDEVGALVEKHGRKWYELFGFTEEEVPKPILEAITEEEAKSKNAKKSKREE